jgi:uncharacterized repeat protein (TIGR01451 family)
MTNTTARTGRPWVAALLAGALAAITTLLMAFGSAAGAQTAQAGPDLALKKTVYPRAVEVGERQTFTIRITNEGSRRAEELKMTDPLPSKVRFIKATTSRRVPGSCGIEDRVVTCRLGTLGVDKTVTVKIYVKPVVAGSYTNRAYVSYGSPSAIALVSDNSDNSDAARALVEARRPQHTSVTAGF